MNVKLEYVKCTDEATDRTVYKYRVIELDAGDIVAWGVELTLERAKQSGHRQLEAIAYFAGIDHLPGPQVRQ